MSRIGNSPIPVPSGVKIDLKGTHVKVTGPKGTLERDIRPEIEIVEDGDNLLVKCKDESKRTRAFSGLTRSLVNNMVVGVSQGFEKKLELIGVGYRAQAQGNKLNLTLGFSHPVSFDVPDGITVTTPSQTEIVIAGADKQKVGQVAAEIRRYRPPEPYKGKGVRYSDERVVLKEAKKK